MLELRDFAIAEELEVHFGPGLNVLTGETGAGKSLLVDALALLSGARADPGLIRSGAEQALVQATWSDQLSVSRRLVHEGRNMARVDGEVVSVSELSETLAERLGIFGQQAFRTLLDASEQRALLDRHLSHEGQRAAAEVAVTFETLDGLRARRAALLQQREERERRRELLEYQLNDIDSAALLPGEDAALDARLQTLTHQERIREGIARALSALTADEQSASEALGEGYRALQQSGRYDAELQRLGEELGDLLSATQAIAQSLESALERIEGEPGELDRLQRRRAALDALERKYGTGVEGVLARREALAIELAELRSEQHDEGALAARQATLELELAEAAARLSAARQEVAALLSPRVSSALHELALPHARFEVLLEGRAAATRYGAERIVFLFCANAGEELAPLTEVVSGGELSRVMLALHVAAGSRTPTLVFDEVDAGLGGRTGRAVGAMLAQLARGRQVLVVTHLAQVAAFADHHLRVDKHENAGRTRTSIERLSGDGRTLEIARMLAGDNSEAALAHARALLRDPSNGREG